MKQKHAAVIVVDFIKYSVFAVIAYQFILNSVICQVLFGGYKVKQITCYFI